MKYKVEIGPEGEESAKTDSSESKPSSVPTDSASLEDIPSPLEGVFFLTKGTEHGKKPGDAVKKDETMCDFEARQTYNSILANHDGIISEMLVSNCE